MCDVCIYTCIILKVTKPSGWLFLLLALLQITVQLTAALLILGCV